MDRLGPAFLPHFKEAGIVNVTYAQLDIMAPDFLAKMQALVAQAGGRRTAVLGMHLCGLLRREPARDGGADVSQPQRICLPALQHALLRSPPQCPRPGSRPGPCTQLRQRGSHADVFLGNKFLNKYGMAVDIQNLRSLLNTKDGLAARRSTRNINRFVHLFIGISQGLLVTGHSFAQEASAPDGVVFSQFPLCLAARCPLSCFSYMLCPSSARNRSNSAYAFFF